VDTRLVYRLKASRAEWVKPPNHWKLRDYEIRTFEGEQEEMIFGNHQSIDTTLNMFHDDFVLYENDKLRIFNRNTATFCRAFYGNYCYFNWNGHCG